MEGSPWRAKLCEKTTRTKLHDRPFAPAARAGSRGWIMGRQNERDQAAPAPYEDTQTLPADPPQNQQWVLHQLPPSIFSLDMMPHDSSLPLALLIHSGRRELKEKSISGIYFSTCSTFHHWEGPCHQDLFPALFSQTSFYGCFTKITVKKNMAYKPIQIASRDVKSCKSQEAAGRRAMLRSCLLHPSHLLISHKSRGSPKPMKPI